MFSKNNLFVASTALLILILLYVPFLLMGTNAYVLYKDNLDSELTIGFKGNPNVGSIVLNSFENSPEFKLFTNIFDKDKDRVFIISSIFGGTGASGFPLLVKLIRNNNADNVQIIDYHD